MKVKPLIILLMALLAFAAPAHADSVGSIKELTGTVTVTHKPAGDTATLAVGAAISPQDVIETALQSRVKIVFKDGTEIVLSGKGKLDVEDYIFDEADETKNKARYSFAGGAYSYVSGLVARKKDPDVIIKTDFGSIGIRGTRIIGALKNRLGWLYVDKGEVEFSNAGGKALLPAGNGTSIRSAEDAPRPPYLWGEDEINWLQRAIDDPAAQDTPAMVARLDESQQQRMRQKEAEDPQDGPTAGGGAALEAAAPAAPAANAVQPAPAQLARPAAEADMAPAKAAKAIGGIAPEWRDIVPLPDDAKDGKKAASLETADTMRFETDKPKTIPLAEMDPTTLLPDDRVIEFSAQLKAESIKGSAYLELRVHAAGQDGPELYARTLDDQLVTAGEWRSFTTSFVLKGGPRPDKITASLVINGTGTVLVKGLRLRAASE